MLRKILYPLVFLTLAIWIFAAKPARAVTYSFHPVLYSKTVETPEESQETYSLWPFFESRSGPSGSFVALHPIFSATDDTSRGLQRTDILWPLGSTLHKTDPDTTRTTSRSTFVPLWFSNSIESPEMGARKWSILFPFYYGGQRDLPDGESKDYQILFPFYWRFNNDHIMFPLYWNKPDDSYAFWPFYGRFLNLFSFDKIEFVMWPLWVTSQAGDVRSRSVVWPVFGYSTSDSGTGWRVWPLAGYRPTEKGSRFFYVWPLGQYAEFTRGPLKGGKLNMFFPFWIRFDHQQRTIRYYFPAYGSSVSPRKTTEAYVWPVYSHTVSQKPAYVEDSVFWFLWSYKRGPEVYDWRTLILAGWREEPNLKRGYALWPLGIYKWDRVEQGRVLEGYEKEQQYFVPFYFRKTTTYDSGRIDYSNMLWPFAAWRQEGTEKEFSALRLFWYGKDDGVARNWGSLWTFYTQRSNPAKGLKETRLFGPLYHSLKDPSLDASEVNFLFFRYEREGKERRMSFLGGAWPMRLKDAE